MMIPQMVLAITVVAVGGGEGGGGCISAVARCSLEHAKGLGAVTRGRGC